MSALVFRDGLEAGPTRMVPRPLTASDLGPEKWLQKALFAHPELIPIEEIDPGAAAVAPICRELMLTRPQGPVYLDMLGVTRRGRPVLVECKLWRNPQARREVVGQVLEYAGLLKRLSYADLSAQVTARTKSRDQNPMWSLAAGPLGLTDEAGFVNAVSENLARGDFDLVVVGDGIRSEIEAIRGYLEAAMGLRSRLALIEIKALWSQDGQVALFPQIAMRTQVVEHRWFSAGDEAPPEPLPTRVVAASQDRAGASQNREFWQRFIDTAVFSHADQPAPTHGSNNWVRLPLPAPFGHATAYRARGGAPYGRLGVFTYPKGEAGKALFELAEQDIDAAETELDGTLNFSWGQTKEDQGCLAVDLNMEAPLTEDQQLEWLRSRADAFITFMRTRIAALNV